jgi:hypothetical protein
MEIEQVPPALQERLGLEATTGLLQLFERSQREWKADVMMMCSERFERRVVEEISGVRLHIGQVEMSIRRDMTEMGSGIRQDMTAMGASIRQEMTEMGASIRQDMTEMGASIRQDMAAMGASIRQDMASGRVELLKWCFLFWIGQVFAMAGIMGMMLRMFRP